MPAQSSANVVELSASDGTKAQIAVGVGFNCFSFQPVFVDGPQEVLWHAPAFLTGEARPAGSGIPILFPFPGRVRSGSFDYAGKHYEIPAGDGRGNAIHGFVLDRSWEVVSQSDESITARFCASEHAPEVLRIWPSDFEISVRYEVRPKQLISNIRITNPGDTPLPYGLGTHPYFRVPLCPQSNADACLVKVPASEFWELRDLIPTGEKQTCDEPRNLTNGKPFAETDLDDVLTRLTANDDGTIVTSLEDVDGKRTLTFEFPQSFRECVVYNPPHREAICIEPYSCVPGAIGDVLSGTLDAKRFGIEFLKPSESRDAKMTIRVD